MDMARASIAREKDADAEKHKNMLDNARKVDSKRRSLNTESSEVIQKIMDREKKHKEIGKALKDFSAIAKNIDSDEHMYHAAKIVKSHDMAMSASDLVKLYNRIRNSKNYEKSYAVFDAWESVDKANSHNREEGTDSLVKILKSDTPGEKENKINEAQTPLGKHIATVNGYHIHDRGASVKDDKRFLAYANHYGWISHSGKTKSEVEKKSKEYAASKPIHARTDHDDWKDDMKHKISSGEVRRAVMSRRGVSEEINIDDKFETFLEAKARGFEGKMIDVPNVPVRMANGKIKSFPAGKSSSSDGGSGDGE